MTSLAACVRRHRHNHRGTLIIVSCITHQAGPPANDMDGMAAFAVCMLLPSLFLLLVGRLGAWWFHG